MASIQDRTMNYFKESYQEMKKVVWPTRRELISHTIIVIVFSVVVAFFLAALDLIFTIGIEKLITFGK